MVEARLERAYLLYKSMKNDPYPIDRVPIAPSVIDWEIAEPEV